MQFRTTIAPGAHIELRDAIWRVTRVDSTSKGGRAFRCVGVSEIVRDQEAIFLEEFESEIRVLDPRATQLVRDTSSQHRAGLLYIESLLRDVPPPDDGLYVGHRAAMDVLEFQLEPARLALSRPRQRILIADSVGLGKTLEAGILLSELVRRGRARRILVVTTKSMLTQFQKEMWCRFTIPLVRLDSVGLARIRTEIPSHHNPFYHFDRTIISIDTLKQNNWFRVHVEKAHWDVVVIDEAHNVASRGGRDSQRAGIAATLARHCDSLVMLSATPHDGKARSFASLMNLLDPTAIADPEHYTREDIRGLYVRRFKSDVKDQIAGHVPERQVMTSRASATEAEEAAFDLLGRLQVPALDAHTSGGILFRTGLVKALFSSPRACLAQLRSPLRRTAIAKALRRQGSAPQLESTRNALEHAAEVLASQPALARDLRTLAELATLVEVIDAEQFSKYRQLLHSLERLNWTVRGAKEDRLLVFTERRETQSFLVEHLRNDLSLADGQCEELHGQMSDIEQQRVVEEFGKSSSKIRLLVATDVASEGLNLHYLCHRMIHFDLPWSLMVFQQRNGRIDRYGQSERPQIVYLRTDSRNEVIQGDNRILDLLHQKAEQAEQNLGDPSALMGVFDIEAEEAMTAQAIQAGISADEWDSQLDAHLLDPFAMMLEGAAAPSTVAVPTHSPLSLFASDFDFVATGLESLRGTGDLEATIESRERRIELRMPDDLARRYRRLPKDVRPDDGVLLLTADTERMQRALAEARREEEAWPRHQLLWANSPVVDWLVQRMRAGFGRHTAPILRLPALGDGARTAIVVSGLLPNRRGQSLVHRWYVCHFEATRFQRIEPFEDFLADSRLGTCPLPNRGDEVDADGLERLLGPAIDAVERRVLTDRDRFRAEMGPKLNEELERLETLLDRQLDFVGRQYEGRTDSLAEHRRQRKERRVRTLFRDYQRWIRDAMTTAEKPFLQVVAVLVGGAG